MRRNTTLPAAIVLWLLATASLLAAPAAAEDAYPRHGVALDATAALSVAPRLRYEYGLSRAWGVAAIVGAASPATVVLQHLNRFECGVQGIFLGIGNRTHGMGLLAQLLWRHSWGGRAAENVFNAPDVPAISLTGDAVTASFGVAARFGLGPHAFIEANGLLGGRYSVATMREAEREVEDTCSEFELDVRGWIGWQW
ncbi:MAG: hypothetical protein H6747_12545 [Deltaproteobacteria bacterium]|nr:hypothetical protein [Deltaproteobacteria bacterium]